MCTPDCFEFLASSPFSLQQVTHVPVLPDHALEEWSMSRDVLKSDNITRGLGTIYQWNTKDARSETDAHHPLFIPCQ